MQIGSYSLASYSSMQSMHLAFNQADNAAPRIASDPANTSSPDSKVSLSADGLAASAADTKQQSTDVSPATSMLKNVLKQMFGLDVDLVDVQQLHTETKDSVNAASASVTTGSTGSSKETKSSQSASAQLYQEDHSASFSMSGTITTKDGKKLNFSLDFSMETHLSYAGMQASQQNTQKVQNGQNGQHGESGQSSLPQFTLGNDAGSLSGASVLAALTQLFQPATNNTAAPGASDTDKTKGDAIKTSLAPLLAEFKLWLDGDNADTPLIQHKLRANVLPKPDNQQETKKEAGSHDDDDKAASSINVSV